MSYYVPVTSAAFFSPFICFFFFFFTDTAPPEIYTLSLHDALPISRGRQRRHQLAGARPRRASRHAHRLPAPALPIRGPDRKSTRLNSSHITISYAVFCLKKKTQKHSRLRFPHYSCHFISDPSPSYL